MRARVHAPRRSRALVHIARAKAGDKPLEELVERTLRGDPRAWRELWIAVEPTLWTITAHFRLSSQLSRREDDRRNMVVRIMEQLRADDFRRLRMYKGSLAREPRGSFRAWLTTMASRSAISYVRMHAEYLGPPSSGDWRRSRWVQLVPLPDELDDRPADPLQAIEGRTLLEQARRQLRREQLGALVLWLEGQDHHEIAERLGLNDDKTADRLVRSALKRLRDRVGTRAGERAASLVSATGE